VVQNLPLVLLPGEVEQLLRMSRWTLKRQRDQGEPPGALAIRVGPRLLRYPTAAVQDYLETQGVSRAESGRRILELTSDDPDDGEDGRSDRR
jgi:hypothetical protein